MMYSDVFVRSSFQIGFDIRTENKIHSESGFSLKRHIKNLAYIGGSIEE